MSKTIDVAADRAYDQTKTVLPAEVARGIYMRNAPSLQALKLMHLMIGAAGGRMATEVQHEISLSNIRSISGMRNHDRASLTSLFEELRAAVLTHDDTNKKRVIIGGLLDEAQIDYRHENDGELFMSWWFARTFRRMAAESDHWAILDRQTVFHLGSKYSLLLFQHIASLSNLNRVSGKKFTIPELRMVLGVPEGKVKRFADLNRDIIKPIVSEINELSQLFLIVTKNKTGRSVTSVTIAWKAKPDEVATQIDLENSPVRRVERRGGVVESVVVDVEPSVAKAPSVAFPASGSLKNDEGGHWRELTEKHVQRLSGGHLPDLTVLTDQFRAFCKAKTIPLDSRGIEKAFIGFCKRYNPPW